MKRTIYLPDELAQRVDDYLRFHRDLTFSALVQQVLEQLVMPRDRGAILKLAGFVESRRSDTPSDDSFIDRPEDSVVLHDR